MLPHLNLGLKNIKSVAAILIRLQVLLHFFRSKEAGVCLDS